MAEAIPEVWLAPAKINLWLEVVGRRSDGYHRIHTAYQTIDLCDTIRLEPGAGPGVRCRVVGEAAQEVPEGDENLAVRAARLLAARTGHDLRLALTIEKRIPAGAGLGGGSSDAAAVLLALARRFAVPDPAHTLHDLAAETGADVPFFLQGGTRIGRGIGDRVSPAGPPAESWGILLWPGIRVATAEAYAAWDRAHPAGGGENGDPEVSTAGWRERRNDLESLVAERHPEVARALGILAAGPAGAARMTGSGSAVFALYADPAVRDADLERVRDAARTIPGAGVRAFGLAEHGARPEE